MIDMAGACPEGRLGVLACAHRARGRTTSTRSASRPARPIWCSAATSSCPAPRKVLAAVREDHTIFVANTAEIMPGDFARSADFSLPVERLKKAIRKAAGEDRSHLLRRHAAPLRRCSAIRSAPTCSCWASPASMAACRLSPEAIEKAIELNGEAVAMNVAAFRWGRRAAHQPDFVRGLAGPRAGAPAGAVAETLDDIVARRAEFLTGYQDAAYAAALSGPGGGHPAAEAEAAPGSTAVSLERRPEPLQADGGEGRVRGRATLYGRLLPEAARRPSSSPVTSSNSIWRRRCSNGAAATASRARSRFGPG